MKCSTNVVSEKAKFRYEYEVSKGIKLQIDFTFHVNDPAQNGYIKYIVKDEILKCLNHIYDQGKFMYITNISYYQMTNKSNEWKKKSVSRGDFCLVKR